MMDFLLTVTLRYHL